MSSSLWAVTCLFNPMGYTRRRLNFVEFRKRLSLPLIAVELSFGGRFELGPKDADILVQVSDGDILWQKERLLNIGIARLPAECEFVAVLDADVAFENKAWSSEAVRALEHSSAVQPFDTAAFLSRDSTFDTPQKPVVEQRSVAFQLAQGRSIESCLGPQTGDGRGKTSGGVAWVFRRDILDRHGLFDRSIVGGGDTANACASLGAFQTVEARHVMNAAQRAFYRQWAEPWRRDFIGKVGFVPGTLRSLWHGDIANRHAGARHTIPLKHDFDPTRDIIASPDGAWRWNSDKPRLQHDLVEYFASRREDG